MYSDSYIELQIVLYRIIMLYCVILVIHVILQTPFFMEKKMHPNLSNFFALKPLVGNNTGDEIRAR